MTLVIPSLLFILLTLGPSASPGHARPQHSEPLDEKNVLILNAFESNVPAFEKTNQGLSAALQSGGIGIRNQFYEHLDLVRHPGRDDRNRLVELMRQRYDQRKIDFIITVYPEALKFLLQEGQSIFSDAPVLALYLPQGYALPETGRRIIPHFVIPDLRRTLEIALKLVPKAKRVYVVGGAHPVDRWLENIARQNFKTWEGRLEFHYLSGQPLAEILATVSRAPSESIVFITSFGKDPGGKYLTSVEVSRQLARVSKAPVFGFLDTLLGNGIVGGSLVSFEYIGTRAGHLALEVLRGTRPADQIPLVLEVPQLDTFDWHQLGHWNLRESDLPSGSIVVNREFSLWDLRFYAIVVLAFILAQSLLIAGLLVQKRRRRSAEESLRQKSEELDQFFNVSPDLLCLANTDGYFLRLNPAWESILGYSRPELREGRFFDYIHPDDLARTQDAVSLLVLQKNVVHFENRYRCKNGTYRWLEWDAAPVGKTIYAAARDITKRKKAEEELKERLMFESLLSEISTRFINLPVEQIDSEIETAQRCICETLGLDLCVIWQVSAETPSLVTLDYLFSPQESWPRPGRLTAQEMFPWQLHKTLAGETLAFSTEDLPPEAALDKESRRRFGIQSSVVIPLPGNDGRINRVISFNTLSAVRNWSKEAVKGLELVAQVLTNAIDRKRSEEALRESEARLNLATNAAGAGLWIVELDTREVWVSAETRVLFHFSPHEKLTYESLLQVIHPDDHEPFQLVVEQTLQGRKPIKIDHRIVLPDGSIRWISTHGQGYPNTKPVRLIGVSFDITERLKAETEARQRREELAHVTRIATMGELTASLAHEINQPLTAILSNAEAAQRFLSLSTPDISEVREILNDIIQDDRRASEVIGKVRGLVRKEKPHEEFLDLNQLIQEVVGLVRRDSLLEGLSIAMELTPGLKAIQGDRIQLQQVILNLILNGAAAMRNSSRSERKIIVRTTMLDDLTLKASVTDLGTGVDEDKIAQLFEPFYTTKPEGLGMGLSISQTIIKDHGGTIEARNDPQGGATFAFTLPAHQGDQP